MTAALLLNQAGRAGLEWLDYSIIGVYVLASVLIGFLFAKRGTKSTADFFISGRSLPWWLAGTALVATTFAADTPLAVAGFVAKNGVAGNWVWWGGLFSGMTTVFFFSRLWRRSEVMTDVEFVELRYSGRPASFLRGFRAVYLALVVNLVIMGWVNLGMAKVLEGTLQIDRTTAIGFCLGITLLYSLVSGHRGVAAAGGFQFLVAMGGAIMLAVLSVNRAGGIDAIREKIGSIRPAGAPLNTTFGSAENAMSFFPTGDDAWSLPFILFMTYVAVNWWSTWYPGAEPGGGGYVAQNIAACRDERHGRGAVLLFNFANYAIRSWPWIVTGLAGVVLIPEFTKTPDGRDDAERLYVDVMNLVLPPGLRGLMLASFAAAFMSTQATQMSWGSSYLINDLYRRFINKGASEKHYTVASRAAVVLTLVLSSIVSGFMTEVGAAWKYLMMIGSGTGLVYMLRWYWWRINAWSEISAMATALPVALYFDSKGSAPRDLAHGMLMTTLITTFVWVAVTLLTQPESPRVLDAFYRKVRPAGPGWRPVAARLSLSTRPGELVQNLVRTVLGIAAIYSALFATGAFLLHEYKYLFPAAGVCVVSAAGLAFLLMREARDSGIPAERNG